MKPVRIDTDGVPLFSSNDIEDYGLPEHWGYEQYRVIESLASRSGQSTVTMGIELKWRNRQ